MFSPVVFLVAAIESLDDKQMSIAFAGVSLMWLGLSLEAIADHQKSNAKAKDPNSFVSSGLYRWVRYPNYLGEILVWNGNFFAGIVAYKTWWHWMAATIGVVCIILIMIGSTKRLESKQAQCYGEDPNYKKYVKTVPVLFPWLPIYSLINVRVYLE
jgi:steroid 5-alpha reductase family enzyme